jgi:anti-sigma factor RsiW
MSDPQTRAMLCDRTREWLALRLDGEVSEFETTLMQAHLDRCEPCRLFGSELSEITRALRSAPLEPLLQPVMIPRRRRLAPVTRQLQALAAAALLVLAAGIGGIFGAWQGPADREVSPPLTRSPMLASADPLLRNERLQSLVPSRPLPLGAAKPVLKIPV